MKVETVYRKGSSKVNEDAFVANADAGVFAVIDGATGLVQDERASGEIASRIVKDALDNRDGLELDCMLRVANRYLGLCQGTQPGKPNPPSHEERSSCGAVVARIESGLGPTKSLSFAQIGDCMLFLQYDDGTVRALTQDPLSVFDDAVLGQLRELWLLACEGEYPNNWDKERYTRTFASLRQEISPSLIANRRRMNSPGGYGVLDGSEEALSFIESRHVSLNRVNKILLLTDGLLLPTTDTTREVWHKSAKIAFKHGLRALEQAVLEREAHDPACNTHGSNRLTTKPEFSSRCNQAHQWLVLLVSFFVYFYQFV